jgi:YHYH protein
MKTLTATAAILLLLSGALAHAGNVTDPRTNSWLTTFAGKYARIYTSDANRTNGVAYTTWTNGTTIQSLPAYCGVQEVYSSSNFVYIRSTGLGSHIMGAWYGNSNHTTGFPTYPTNQHVLFKLPRHPVAAATNTLSGGGAVGIFVDGVAMYNNWDANIWNGTADTSSTGGTNGYWNRDAYVNEGSSFDPAYAHQPVSGQYHYHANPPALRYELGDHVDFNPVTKIYTESASTPTKHSPILGWAADGYPIYGPYGYSSASNSASGIRRMVSGYVIRDGQYGTSNLTANGRSTLPLWATRFYNCASNVLAGPPVNSSYPLGRYMEDNDYLGDHGYVQGVTFDLDQYNGRWCYTPEFPGGTYAYFVAISSNGTPVYPYNLGFAYYGTPAGGSVSFIQETVATNFLGYTNLAATLNPPAVNNGSVTLAWSALEGGTYQVQGTTNFSGWTTLASGVTPSQISGGYTNATALNQQFYRVGRTAVAAYDSAGTTYIGGGIDSVSPASAARGSSFTLTINLNANVNPPPTQAPINSITLGAIAGTGATHVSTNQVTCSITIPGGAATGAQTVTLVFPGPPQNPSATQTFFLTNGFTIN